MRIIFDVTLKSIFKVLSNRPTTHSFTGSSMQSSGVYPIFRACDSSLLHDWLMARYQLRIIIIYYLSMMYGAVIPQIIGVYTPSCSMHVWRRRACTRSYPQIGMSPYHEIKLQRLCIVDIVIDNYSQCICAHLTKIKRLRKALVHGARAYIVPASTYRE